MPRKSSTQLTEVELQVLQILWSEGPSTARQIHRQLTKLRDTAYSSTTTMLAVMLDKNLLMRDEKERPHVFHPRLKEAQAKKRVVKEVIERIYQGSTSGLVIQALSSKKISPQELDEIRKILDRIQDKSS